MAPLTLVGATPRYLDEIVIASAVMTAADEGIEPVVRCDESSTLDWNGVTQVTLHAAACAPTSKYSR